MPIFFVTSGMAIDPSAVAENKGAFAAVFVLIILARGLPVFLVTRFAGPRDERQGVSESAAVAAFAATGLPIIVAVTAVSVTAGHMTEQDASVLVAAGAATVLLLPMLGTLLAQSDPEQVRDQPG